MNKLIAILCLALLIIGGAVQAVQIDIDLSGSPDGTPGRHVVHQASADCLKGILSSKILAEKGYLVDLTVLLSGTSSWTGKNPQLIQAVQKDILPRDTDGFTLMLHKPKGYYSERVLYQGRWVWKTYGVKRAGEPIDYISCPCGERQIVRDLRCGNPGGGHYYPKLPHEKVICDKQIEYRYIECKLNVPGKKQEHVCLPDVPECVQLCAVSCAPSAGALTVFRPGDREEALIGNAWWSWSDFNEKFDCYEEACDPDGYPPDEQNPSGCNVLPADGGTNHYVPLTNTNPFVYMN